MEGQLGQVAASQGDHNQEVVALQAELLILKKQIQDVSFEKGKMEYKLQTANENLQTAQDRVKDLEKTIH